MHEGCGCSLAWIGHRPARETGVPVSEDRRQPGFERMEKTVPSDIPGDRTSFFHFSLFKLGSQGHTNQ